MTTVAAARLPVAAKVRLAVEITRDSVRTRRLLRRDDLPAALARSRATATPHRSMPSHDDVARLARAVRRTLAALPGDSRCLVSSLVLIAVLARRGVAGALVIGVRPGTEFGAHAWVEVDGLPVLPGAEGEFARLVAL